MGELHSNIIACLQTPPPNPPSSSSLLAWWDFHNNLGAFNADMSHFMESTPPFLSQLQVEESDDINNGEFSTSSSSTGYLQDALFEFSTKRRRLHFSNDHTKHFTHQYSKNCDDEYKLTSLNYYYDEKNNDYDYLSQIIMAAKADTISPDFSSSSVNGHHHRPRRPPPFSNSVDYDKDDDDDKKTILLAPPPPPGDSIFPSENRNSGGGGEKRKKGCTAAVGGEIGGSSNGSKVAYPFAVVKPGGIEGEVTLNDINERILMPPTRPVRHPVGDYACRPLVSGPDGPGLSGKAVVALTRIHTQGRGTITIIRTRG